jgi:membrane-bound serine protease (ClpP class)
MKAWLALVFCLPALLVGAAEVKVSSAGKTIVIIPIREDIAPPLVYLVRRGVKQAIEEKADLLVLDMKTDGGRIDTTEDIISIIGEFKGETVTFVNDRAFSAGAFISVATKKIYMAPQSVIGAAAPVMMAPGGQPQDMPGTMEVKMKSAVRALVRRVAEKNGHNVDVVEAMIDKNKELKIDGVVLNEKGDILTLTDTEAAKEYGDPKKPLLSLGTVENMDALLLKLGYVNAKRIDVQPTGAEKLGSWINMISPLLLIIGAVGLYIEFKTPGFGLPGIVGITAFAIYFAGGYIAGFSGLEWMLVFLVGAVLLALELFVFPGTVAIGVVGALLMLLSIVMALVDLYPNVPAVPNGPTPAWPRFAGPTAGSVEDALRTLLIAIGGVAIGVWLASKLLPKTSMYTALISQGVSGGATTAAYATLESTMLGAQGVSTSTLRPGGKAQFGETILDVRAEGGMIGTGKNVRIIGFSSGTAVVEEVV